MKRYLSTIFIVTLLMFFCTAGNPFGQTGELDVKELVRKVETQYQGDNSHSTATMTVVTEHWTRELVMEMWSEGRDKFIATILSPKKEQGTSTLKIDEDMWNYLPKIDRLIKIPSSLMGDSWMGSHFTNDDLVKENKIDELYDLSLKRHDGNIVVVDCVPKPDAAVVWGRIEYTVDIGKLIPIEVHYFDEDGELVRTMTFDRVEQVSGRWLPLHMVILPVEKPDERTELLYDNIEFDVKLESDRFSLRSLRGR